MCLSLCHQRGVIYFNHEETLCRLCPRGRPNDVRPGESAKGCAACRHRQGDTCSLAASGLPLRGWCCHFDVQPLAGALRVGPETVEPALRREYRGDLAEMLDDYGIDYRVEGAGLQIEVADLAVPLVYGVPSDDWEAVLGCGVAGVVLQRSERCA